MSELPSPIVEAHASVQQNFDALRQLSDEMSAGLSAVAAAVALVSSVLPGTLVMTVGATADAGYLLCDGASYLRATYPALFVRLGGVSSPFGLPDGTHFNVPDFRGRMPMGSGTGVGGGGAGGVGLPAGPALTAHPMATWGGEETHLLSTTEMPSHTHGPGNVYNETMAPPAGAGRNLLQLTVTANQNISMAAAGGGGAHNNIPPVVVVNFQVKT